MYKAILMTVFLTLSFTATVSAVPSGSISNSPYNIPPTSSSPTGAYNASWLSSCDSELWL